MPYIFNPFTSNFDFYKSYGLGINNEIVSGSGTLWALAKNPILGAEHIYANGQRLIPGISNDYSINGQSIVTNNSFASGTLIADY